MKSDLHDFHKLSVKKRLDAIKKHAKLTEGEVAVLGHDCALGTKTANMMIENVIGTTQLPIGLATNFLINDRDYLIPMALEEPSVVAAASYAAKLARNSGGFTTSSEEALMIGQIQLVGLKKIKNARKAVLKNKDVIKQIANHQDSMLVKLGGGARDIEARTIKTKMGKMLIVQLVVDVKDAMGANAVNTMTEAVSRT